MKKILLLLLVIPLCSCATTRTYSHLNKDYQNNYTVSKVVVSFEGIDSDEKLELEEQITQKLSAYNVEVIKYRGVISSTKNNTDENTLNKIKESGADALLILDVQKSSMSQYIPAAQHRTADGIGTYTTGGHDGTTLTMRTKSSLIDVENGNLIWNAETGTTANSKSNYPWEFDYSGLFNATFDDMIVDINNKGLFK